MRNGTFRITEKPLPHLQTVSSAPQKRLCGSAKEPFPHHGQLPTARQSGWNGCGKGFSACREGIFHATPFLFRWFVLSCFFTMKMYIYAFLCMYKITSVNFIQINTNSALCASVWWRQPVETQNFASHEQRCVCFNHDSLRCLIGLTFLWDAKFCVSTLAGCVNLGDFYVHQFDGVSL